MLRYTFAGDRVIDTTLERFQRCQHAVSTAGDSDGGENAADIIQNCTDIQRLDGRKPTPAELRNIQSRQLAYLQEVDPQVKVIVQQYCDADLLRTPRHFDQDPSQIRRVHRIYVEMCQEWFLGSEYAAVRARWQASYEADQAWEKRFYAPPRPRPVVNGAIQVHVPRTQDHDPEPVSGNPGDGVVGPNRPPPITTITPHDSNVPVEQTPMGEFDKDGYALVVGGVVHKYTPQGSTQVRCVFHGYDDSLFNYQTCP